VVVRLHLTDDNEHRDFPPLETLWYHSDWLDDLTGEPGLKIYRSPTDGSFTLRYADGVEFIVNATGDRVRGRRPAKSSVEDAATYLTGPVLGFLLRIRRVVSLHASAIEIGGSAVVLVGDTGAGKSTTAAMFARLGYDIITEDIAALIDVDGGLMVGSGYADIALWPEAVMLLYGSSDALPRFMPGWEKRRLDLAATGAFAVRSVPLGAVYLLADRGGPQDAPCVSPVSAGEAMVKLLGNIYGNRVFHEELRVHELDIIHRIVGTVPVKAAAAGPDGNMLERFCEVILEDVSYV
jgi:energy-coupling factor transporter ATP-binding protein EcfA2